MKPLKTDFLNRVDRAAITLTRGTPRGRAYEECFHGHGDGDAVVVALVRRADKNPELHAGIVKAYGGFPSDWRALADAHRDEASVSRLAASLRDYYDRAVGNKLEVWVVHGPQATKCWADHEAAQRHTQEIRRAGYKVPDPRGYPVPLGPEGLAQLINEILGDAT